MIFAISQDSTIFLLKKVIFWRYTDRMKYSEQQKEQSKSLYLKGHKVPEIEKELSIERRTIYLWIKNVARGSKKEVSNA